jgi:carboxymethylenebutenolidase
MSSQMIPILSQEGQSFTGYLSTPTSGQGPGIVLIQEIFGVNNSIRAVADRLAQEGYTVLAPDLFWRLKPNVNLNYTAKDMEEAYDYYHRFDLKHGIADLGEAVKTLRDNTGCTGKVASLGFCLGGKLAYLTAAHHNVDAAVAFYGGGIAQHLAEAKNIQCPLLMHFGAEDEMIPEEQVDEIKAAFHNRSNVEIYVYDNVGHAFYNADRSSYNPVAAELAHQRTLQFLHKYL